MFVTAMVTLAEPLAPNMPLTIVSPIAFTLTDGVQTITNLTAPFSFFQFATGPTGAITFWSIIAATEPSNIIESDRLLVFPFTIDVGNRAPGPGEGTGRNIGTPGIWVVPDTGSTLSLMTLTLMALGLVARRLQRAAA
jgi:hypothetical protein